MNDTLDGPMENLYANNSIVQHYTNTVAQFFCEIRKRIFTHLMRCDAMRCDVDALKRALIVIVWIPADSCTSFYFILINSAIEVSFFFIREHCFSCWCKKRLQFFYFETINYSIEKFTKEEMRLYIKEFFKRRINWMSMLLWT